VLEFYDWDRKGEQLAQVYEDTVVTWDTTAGKTFEAARMQ
jgi:hypothetical protein